MRSAIWRILVRDNTVSVMFIPRHRAGSAGHEEGWITDGVSPCQPMIQKKAPSAELPPFRVGGHEIHIPMSERWLMTLDPFPEARQAYRVPTVFGEHRVRDGVNGVVVIGGTWREPGTHA